MIWVLLIVVLYVILIAPSFRRKSFYQRKYAHRGLYSSDQSVKENSLEAFELAIKKGYGLELDVRLSQDDQVVVYHDDSLMRLEGSELKVSQLTLKELREFKVPTLVEVLTLVDSSVEVIVELKNGQRDKLLAQKTYGILKEYPGRYCVESFDPRLVFWFRRHASEVMRGQLIQPIRKYDNVLVGLLVNSLLFQFLTRPHFLAINVNSSRMNPSILINQLLGVKSCLWTVHREHNVHRKWVDSYIFEFFNA